MTDADPGALFLDTNVLLVATAPRRRGHLAALELLRDWPNRGGLLCVSGQIVREYLTVCTRPLRVNGLGIGLEAALGNVDEMLPRLRVLDEDARVVDGLRLLLRKIPCQGKQVHDANVVATMLAHGVPRLLTANPRDFVRFEEMIRVDELGLL